jgi:hypothetical protein
VKRFTPSDGFLLDRLEERKTPKSPELLEIERRQAARAVHALNFRIVDTTFTAEELEQFGSPFDVSRIVGKPVLRLHSRPSNVISLREVKARR